MGHSLLGTLPRTKSWRNVVDSIADGSGVPVVAAATLKASDRFLREARTDPGLRYVVWLLMRVVLASRSDDFPAALRDLGFDLDDAPDLVELTAALTSAADDHLYENRASSDIAEMAVLSASESLKSLALDPSQSLFGTTPEHVRLALKGLASGQRFGVLGRVFFEHFLNRYLMFFLSRTLSDHVGGDRRFANAAEHREFQESLRVYCRESCAIVESLIGDWFGKHAFGEGISEDGVGWLVQTSLSKLKHELKSRES